MKTKRFLILATAVAVTFLSVHPQKAVATKGLQVISAKSDSPFGSLRTHRQGKGVTVVWNMAMPDGVAGFTVQRTYEDPTDTYAYWEDLATVAFDASRSFTYTDKEVLPGILSYRIVAVMSDGTTVPSEIVQQRIVARK